jgi:hypothetical protein
MSSPTTPSPAIRVSSGQGGSARSQKSLIAGSTLLAHEQMVGGQSLAEVGVGHRRGSHARNPSPGLAEC